MPLPVENEQLDGPVAGPCGELGSVRRAGEDERTDGHDVTASLVSSLHVPDEDNPMNGVTFCLVGIPPQTDPEVSRSISDSLTSAKG